MGGPVASNGALPLRPSRRRSVLGVRVGHFASWQIVAVAVVIALARHGPVAWASSGVALVGCCLTMLRWRHRWGYEWLAAALTYGNQGSGLTPPSIQVCPARLPSGGEAGVAYDGSGFSVIVAIAAKPSGPPVIELPVAALAGLLDPQDAMVSAVQLVVHAEPAAAGTSVLATAYRNLGYGQVPRSQSVWLALRHDPAVSRYAVGSAGSARDVQVSLLRGLAGRSTRALDVLSGRSLAGQVLDVAAARDLLTKTLVAETPVSGETREAAAATGPSWAAWQGSGQRHVTYWLRRWPAGGIGAVEQALSSVPARSVTTSVLVTAAGAGRCGLTATVRVTTGTGADRHAVGRAVRAAAASCGARLTRLDGEHVRGVLATLPLGRPPAARWPGGHAGGTHESVPEAFLSVTVGGVVIGPQAGGEDEGFAVAVPFFTADGATRTTVVGDPLLHRLLGLRALGSGARLQVVTAAPGPWLRLRDLAQQVHRMTVVRPGAQVPCDGTRADPWMLIDDTGSPAIAASRPWLAVVTALGESAEPGAILSGRDAIVVQRSSRRVATSVAASFDLPQQATRSLEAMPDGLVAVARPGTIRFVRLAPDDAERSILARSMRPG